MTWLAVPPKGHQTFELMAGLWDVTEAKRIAEKKAAKRQIVMIDPLRVVKMFDMESIGVDPEKAMALTPEQLEEPVIFVMLPYGLGMLMIDGWHRCYNAVTNKRHRVRAVILDPKEEVAVRIRPKPWPNPKPY